MNFPADPCLKQMFMEFKKQKQMFLHVALHLKKMQNDSDIFLREILHCNFSILKYYMLCVIILVTLFYLEGLIPYFYFPVHVPNFETMTLPPLSFI